MKILPLYTNPSIEQYFLTTIAIFASLKSSLLKMSFEMAPILSLLLPVIGS